MARLFLSHQRDKAQPGVLQLQRTLSSGALPTEGISLHGGGDRAGRRPVCGPPLPWVPGVYGWSSTRESWQGHKAGPRSARQWASLFSSAPKCSHAPSPSGLEADRSCSKMLRELRLGCCCSVSRVWLSVTPWTAAHQASLSITISQSWLKLMSIELLMPSNHLILCRPLLLLPSIFPSIRVFSNESALHQLQAGRGQQFSSCAAAHVLKPSKSPSRKSYK